jgi:hypothetical protein
MALFRSGRRAALDREYMPPKRAVGSEYPAMALRTFGVHGTAALVGGLAWWSHGRLQADMKPILPVIHQEIGDLSVL